MRSGNRTGGEDKGGLGDFSEALIARYNPDMFYAIDLFTLHEYQKPRSQETGELSRRRTHSEVYLDRMRPHRDRLAIRQGDGAENSVNYPARPKSIKYQVSPAKDPARQ